MAMCGNPPDWFSGVLTGREEMITDDERKWLLEGFPINSSTAATAVPQSKLRELFQFRYENERLKHEQKIWRETDAWALVEERDTLKAKLAEVEAEVEKWKELENFTGCTFIEIFGQAGKLKKGAYAAKPRPFIFCDCNEPENKKIHDEICDILEENAWNEDAVCTASTAIWMTLKYFEREREAAKVMREALNDIVCESCTWDLFAECALKQADEIRGKK